MKGDRSGDGSVRLLGFEEVAVQLGLDEDDAVEELPDDLLLVALVRGADLLLLDLGLLVDRRLHGLCVSCVLQWQ